MPSGKACGRPRGTRRRPPRRPRDPRIPARGEPGRKHRHQDRQKKVRSDAVPDSTSLGKRQPPATAGRRKHPGDVEEDENGRTACAIFHNITLDSHLGRWGRDSDRTYRPAWNGQGVTNPHGTTVSGPRTPDRQGRRSPRGAHAEPSAVPERGALTGSLRGQVRRTLQGSARAEATTHRGNSEDRKGPSATSAG